MLLFGHRYFKREPFYHIFDIDDIAKTPSNATIFVEFDEKSIDIIDHLRLNDISFALSVETITEAIYAENFRARYIVCAKEVAKDIQYIAQEYLFDAKILARVEHENQIEALAKEGVDGVIFSEAIIRV